MTQNDPICRSIQREELKVAMGLGKEGRGRVVIREGKGGREGNREGKEGGKEGKVVGKTMRTRCSFRVHFYPI